MALVPDSKKHFVKFIRKDVGKFKVLARTLLLWLMTWFVHHLFFAGLDFQNCHHLFLLFGLAGEWFGRLFVINSFTIDGIQRRRRQLGQYAGGGLVSVPNGIPVLHCGHT